MSATSLARKHSETFDEIEESALVSAHVEYKIASDEEVKTASSYILAEHIEAYKELAKYDTN